MSNGTITEYSYIRLKPADNGFILSYDEVIEYPGSMKNRDHKSREIVFGDSDEDLNSAMDKMKGLYLFNKKKKGTSHNSDHPVSLVGES